MRNEDTTAADQVLQAIHYGLLPVDEMEKRLKGMVEEELSGAIGAEYDREKVELCNSFLQQIYTNQRIDFPERAEAIKARIVEKHLAYKRRSKRLKQGLGAAAFALCAAAVLMLSNVLPSLKRIPENPAKNTQQASAQDRMISAKTISLDHMEDAESVILSSDGLPYADAVAFLGFDPAMPESVDSAYRMEGCSMLVMPDFTLLSCSYGKENNVQLMKSIYISVREASMLFERGKVGDQFDINGFSVYRYTRAGYQCYLWYGNATIHSLIIKETTPRALAILGRVLEAEKAGLSM